MKHGNFLVGIEGACGAIVALFVLSAKAFADVPIAAADLELVGIAQADGTTYASVVDVHNGEHFLPSTRGADGGLELVSATADESAVIRQKGQSFLLRLGWPSGSGQVANVVPAPTEQNIPRPGTAANDVPAPPPGGKLPLVFQSGDMQGFNLSDGQKAIITRLRAQFVAAIGGGAGTTVTAGTAVSAPSTQASSGAANSATAPSALQNWQSAQEQSDDIFKMLFGYQAFNLYQMGVQSQSAP